MPFNATFPHCPKCKRAYSTGDSLTMNPNAYPHECPPQWAVWEPGATEEADATLLYADDPLDAAELWGEEDDRDSCEYAIAKGRTAIVSVRRQPPEGNLVLTFRVVGYYDPRYSAEPVS